MKISELLDSPAKWTQYVSARTAYNMPTEPEDENAAQYCLIGAVMKCYNDPQERKEVHCRLNEALGNGYISSTRMIADFNDSFPTRFEDVKRVVEAANV